MHHFILTSLVLLTSLLATGVSATPIPQTPSVVGLSGLLISDDFTISSPPASGSVYSGALDAGADQVLVTKQDGLAFHGV